MPRKNSNAGQPNRVAQKERRTERRYVDVAHRPFRSNSVLGPGSGDLLRTRIEYVVQEKVSA